MTVAGRLGAGAAAAPFAEAVCVEKDNKYKGLAVSTAADSGYNKSPEPRAQSPEPRAQSPEPRAQSPEPRAQSPEPRPRRGSPPRPSPPSRATLPHSDTDLPAAGAPAASACPDTGEAGRGVSGISRRRRLAMRRPAGARAATRARSWPGAAAGLLGLAALLALPLAGAGADGTDPRLVNTGQTIDNSNGFVGVFEGRWSAAQGVTTGDSDAGYTLSSVDVGSHQQNSRWPNNWW